MTDSDKAFVLGGFLAEPRNGANRLIQHNRYTPRFVISDGVEELAVAAGSYWLLDLLATELEPKLLPAINAGELATVLVDINVAPDRTAVLRATFTDDETVPPFYERKLDYTDFPEGKWVLFSVGALHWDTKAERALNVLCCLLSER